MHVPPARVYSHCAYDAQRAVTVMFGGLNAGPRADTWEWNGVDWSSRATATSPPARGGGAFGYDPLRARIVLFGGFAIATDLADTWEYDGTNWTQVAVAGPSARRLAAMAFDVVTGRMILFGGDRPAPQTVFGDTWAFDGATWQQLAPPVSPQPRWSHAMVSDAARGQILLYGGTWDFTGLQPQSDTWTFDGATWTNPNPFPMPPSLNDISMSFDTAAGAPIVFSSFPLGSFTDVLADGQWHSHAAATVPSSRWGCTFAYDGARGNSVLFGGYTGSILQNETWIYRTPTIGEWTAFGTGCPGSAGQPTLRRVGTNLPAIGQFFLLEVFGVTNGLVTLVTGFSTAIWQGVPLPVPLDALGMFGCTAYVSLDLFDTKAVLGGSGLFTLTVPSSPSLIGIAFANQAMSADPNANPFRLVVTNAGAGLVGEL